MKHISKITLAGLFMFILSACGSGSKEQKSELSEKKVKLEKLKQDQIKLGAEITKLQDEINKLDTSAAKDANARLVSVSTLSNGDFNHFIELQGTITAENISYVTPRAGMGATTQVKQIYIKKGDYVKKGQLLLKIDDAVQLSQLEGLRTQLKYAEDIYRRQKNLWDQGIGTEVQVLTAENNVKQLKDQINTATTNWDMTNVRSDVNGYVDQLNLKPGESFTGFAGNVPQIVIVNKDELKISANIPENYISRVKAGTPVEVVVPDLSNRTLNSRVSWIGQSIDPNTRGFIVEARITGEASLKPNQVAIMRILDYTAKNVIIAPVNTIQSDEKGKFVYILEKKGDKNIATKRIVTVGETYGEFAEIKSGLNNGDQIITEGYMNLYEGQVVSIAK